MSIEFVYSEHLEGFFFSSFSFPQRKRHLVLSGGGGHKVVYLVCTRVQPRNYDHIEIRPVIVIMREILTHANKNVTSLQKELTAVAPCQHGNDRIQYFYSLT